MSSITDAIAAEKAAFRKGPTCTVGLVLATLKPTERDDLEVALADDGLPATTLSRALTRAGHKVGPEAVRRHRSGYCQCGKP